MKPKFASPTNSDNQKNLLQVQTDFNATLPLSINKPAGSITIKAQPHRKKQFGSIEHPPEECDSAASMGKLKSVSGFGSNPQHARGVHNQQNNGLRPVRLFNYATTKAPQTAREDLQSV